MSSSPKISKQSRTPMSCVGCRKRKIKCSRTLHCASCRSKGIQCVWEHSAPSRTEEESELESAQDEICRLRRHIVYLSRKLQEALEAKKSTTESHSAQAPDPSTPWYHRPYYYIATTEESISPTSSPASSPPPPPPENISIGQATNVNRNHESFGQSMAQCAGVGGEYISFDTTWITPVTQFVSNTGLEDALSSDVGWNDIY